MTRLATRADVPALARLIGRSARALQRADYTDAQIDAALARVYGFRRFELGATLTGVRLFERRGYEAVERVEIPLAGTLMMTVVRMVKAD